MPTRYAALLRAVNIGPHGRIAMKDLKAAVEDAGFTDVQTLLQSGNVVFTSPRKTDVAAAIAGAVEARTGLTTDVMARTHSELDAIVRYNPFPERGAEPAKLHVGFPAAPLSARTFDVGDLPEEVAIGSGVLYLWYPNGVGRSKLTNAVLERQLGVPVTIRNWNTVRKLVAATA